MPTITIWLLIAVSHGPYNRGNVTVLERFANPVDCELTRKQIPADNTKTRCIQATVIATPIRKV